MITMIPAAYPQYSPLIQGLLFLGLLAGTVVSEVCCSGRLSDYIVKRQARQNGGVRVAEMRLWLVYPAALVTAGTFILLFFFFGLFLINMIGMANLLCLPCLVGLVLFGISIDNAYHWMVGQVAFFLCMFP